MSVPCEVGSASFSRGGVESQVSNLSRATELGGGGVRPGLGLWARECQVGHPSPGARFLRRSGCRCGNRVTAVAGLGGLLASGSWGKRAGEEAGSGDGDTCYTPGHQESLG